MRPMLASTSLRSRQSPKPLQSSRCPWNLSQRRRRAQVRSAPLTSRVTCPLRSARDVASLSSTAAGSSVTAQPASAASPACRRRLGAARGTEPSRPGNVGCRRTGRVSDDRAHLDFRGFPCEIDRRDAQTKCTMHDGRDGGAREHARLSHLLCLHLGAPWIEIADSAQSDAI